MARTYGNYEYGTSPKKIQPEYIPDKKAKQQNIKKVKKQIKQNVKSYKKELIIKRKALFYVGIVFSALLVISYRNSKITEQFTEVKNLKSNLATIQKENEQLEVNIESSVNLKTIEKEAMEQLGMKKLDNNQKVYVSLPKTDYVEPTLENNTKTEKNTANWIKVAINSMLGK